MITAIVNKIVTELKTLPFADKVGAISKVISKNVTNSDNNIVVKKYPAVYNLTPQTCSNNSDYVDMIPNDAYASVMYFEELGITTLKRDTQYIYKQADLRLICWLNYKRINSTYYDTDLISSAVIAAIPEHIPNFNGVINTRIEYIGEQAKNVGIFSNYTYNEEEKQYLLYPFDYFALNYRITYRVALSCLDDIVINPDLCQVVVPKCDRLWNNLTDSEKLDCLLPRYDFAQQLVLNSLTQQQVTDIINALCDPSAYTCDQLKALLTDLQKECIIQEYDCPEIFNTLTDSQKECILQSYYFSDGLIFAILTAQQLADITAQLDCTALSNLTATQLISCILPLYDFSDASVIAGLSAQQVLDLEAAICTPLPVITANFAADKLTPAMFETVNFTDLSTGTPNLPNTWNYQFTDNAILKLLNTQNPTYEFEQLGAKTISLLAANTAGGIDVETKAAYITVQPPTIPSGCILELDPARGRTIVSGVLSNWADQSGANNHASQLVVGSRPALVTAAINNRDMFRLDGLNSFLDGTDLSSLNNSDFTILAVTKSENQSNTNPTLIRLGSGANGYAYRIRTVGTGVYRWSQLNNVNTSDGQLTEFIEEDVEVSSITKDVNSLVSFYKKTSLISTTNIAAATAAILTGGNYTLGYGQAAGTYFKGLIGHVYIFNRVLNASELLYMQNLLIRIYKAC